ncbi:unnamed protein product [Malus baccata var. baccata]
MIVRQLLSNRYNPCRRSRGVIDHLKLRPCNFIRTQTLISTPSSQSPPPQTPPSTEIRPFSSSSFLIPLFVQRKIICCCCLVFSPSSYFSGSSQVIIRSDLEFELDIMNIEKRRLSAVFYKVVAPVIVDLSGQFLDVTMYKIVFTKGISNPSYLMFCDQFLPMFFFYKYGEKVAEVIGPDVVGLRDTFMTLYG